MSDQTLLNLGLWAIGVAATFQTLFVMTYATRPWWTHYVGRAMFFKSLALMVVLWVSFSNNIVAPYEHQLLVMVIGLWFVAITVIGQCIALFLQVGHDRLQRRGSDGNEFYNKNTTDE